MFERDNVTAAATDDQTQGSPAVNDSEPEALESSQDGSIDEGMSSQGVDETDGAAEDGSGEDDGDDSEAGSKLSPKLQRKLYEAAQARKKVSELEQRLAQSESYATAFETLMKHKDPAKAIQGFRELMGGSAAPVDDVDGLVPQGDFGFDADTQKGLNAFAKAFAGNLVSNIREAMQPIAREVGNVKTQRANAEWGELVKAHGEGIGKWKAQAEKTSRELGVPLKKALAFVSDGAFATMRAAKAAASARADERTPTLAQARGRTGVGRAKVMASSFADYLAKTKGQ